VAGSGANFSTDQPLKPSTVNSTKIKMKFSLLLSTDAAGGSAAHESTAADTGAATPAAAESSSPKVVQDVDALIAQNTELKAANADLTARLQVAEKTIADQQAAASKAAKREAAIQAKMRESHGALNRAQIEQIIDDVPRTC
jgi:transglutaminase/protease-like cytokinesis protein 3